jgi:hypothetical protein
VDVQFNTRSIPATNARLDVLWFASEQVVNDDYLLKPVAAGRAVRGEAARSEDSRGVDIRCELKAANPLAARRELDAALVHQTVRGQGRESDGVRR